MRKIVKTREKVSHRWLCSESLLLRVETVKSSTKMGEKNN